MKALITGIAGFSGGHLSRLLLDRGYEVAGIEVAESDNSLLPDHLKGIKIYEGDLRDEVIIAKALNDFKPDILFHLAAQTSVKLSFESPLETFSVNVIGTLILLETISKMDFPLKTLVVTSSEIYGRLEASECPVTEDHPLRPINPYAVTKASVDLMAYQYFKAYAMPIYIARAFSHSGPGQKTVGVLSDWAFQAAKIDLGLAQEVIKVGNIDVQRDYTDVRDVSKAYLDIIEKGRPGEAYNVCSGKGYYLRDLLEKYKKFTDKEIKISVDQSRLRPVDIPILIGSNAKIKNDVGWHPEIAIEDTLHDAFTSWREKLLEEVK